jgi:CubicO group peptidase (beta-lactamase class C family)
MRTAALALSLISGLALIVLAIWIAVAGPVTVFRVIRHGDTDIDDFGHYPGRRLRPSESPFRFKSGDEALHVAPETLAQFGDHGNLEQLLESNDSIAFLVVQNDTILYERYFQGHEASSPSQIFSMSKSFTSALIGAAIEDGYIEGDDQAITDFVPELMDEGFADVTIRHLLTMMSGTSYVENDNPFGEHVILNYTPQLEERILEFEMEREPGELFRYKSGDNALLALALDRALGAETITEYTQRRLWGPLGMEDQGVWSIDHEDDGLEKTWCCLAASARDFVKFGRLYLQQGMWQGEEIVPASWIAESTRGQVPDEAWPGEYQEAGWSNYGYHWWLASKTEGDFFALGKDGQFLYLHPSKELIILRLGRRTGDLYSSGWISLFQGIAQEVE